MSKLWKVVIGAFVLSVWSGCASKGIDEGGEVKTEEVGPFIGDFKGTLRLHSTNNVIDEMLDKEFQAGLSFEGEKLRLNLSRDLLGQDCQMVIAPASDIRMYSSRKAEYMEAKFPFDSKSCVDKSVSNYILFVVKQPKGAGQAESDLYLTKARVRRGGGRHGPAPVNFHGEMTKSQK